MIPRRKNVTLDLYITPYTKINSKWIRDSNVRPETVNLLEQTKGKASYLWSWQSLLGYGTKSTGKKTKNKQVVLGQTKKITHRREKTTEWKSNRWTGGKYSQTIYLIKKKKNCFQYIEGLLKFNRGGGGKLDLKMGKGLIMSPKKTYKWTTHTWKDAPYHESPGKRKSKLQWVNTSVPLR